MHIVGHQAVRERLRKLADLSEHPQSFLFVGPENVGKRAVALEFAWKLLGREKDFPARSEEDASHPDIFLLKPERVTEKGKTREKNIPVESIREGIEFLSRYPLVGRKRVLIIDDAHRLSHGAQNALLKTLEEPNITSVIILITHDPAALLDTIHSRLQRIGFSFVPESIMRELALGSDQDDYLLFSLGRPGIVNMSREYPDEFSERMRFLESLSGLAEKSLSEKFRLAEDLSRKGPLIVQLFEWWIPELRKRALLAETVDDARAVYGFLDDLRQSEWLLRNTQANARLQLEKLFLNI